MANIFSRRKWLELFLRAPKLESEAILFHTTLKTEERDFARSVSFDISYLVGHSLSDDIEKVQKGNLATVHKSYGARTEQKSCTVVQKVALVSKGIIQAHGFQQRPPMFI